MLQLLVSTDSDNRNSRPFHWPGGYGELKATGTFDDGTLTLKEAKPSLDAGEADNYQDQGATLTEAGTNGFRCGDALMYVALTGSSGSDEIDCWIVGEDDKTIVKFAGANAVA